MRRAITMLTALAIALGGVALASYAEGDDAPGGVVIGWVLVIGAVALGAKTFRHGES